jgi:hypothetical protein
MYETSKFKTHMILFLLKLLFVFTFRERIMLDGYRIPTKTLNTNVFHVETIFLELQSFTVHWQKNTMKIFLNRASSCLGTLYAYHVYSKDIQMCKCVGFLYNYFSNSAPREGG